MLMRQGKAQLVFLRVQILPDLGSFYSISSKIIPYPALVSMHSIFT